MKARNITSYPNQLYLASGKPLDASLQVQTRDDLHDTTLVTPYVGKLVHVINEHKIYICAIWNTNTHTSTWRPFSDDTGSTLYLTSLTGDVTAAIGIELQDGKPRLTLTVI